MRQRSVLILVIGALALAAIIAITLMAKWGDNSAAINGMVAIAAAAVGALATFAHAREDRDPAPVWPPPSPLQQPLPWPAVGYRDDTVEHPAVTGENPAAK